MGFASCKYSRLCNKQKLMLLPFFKENCIEAGCDEAGRGCLAGPVFAAAVIFDKNYTHPVLTDSKKLNDTQRRALRPQIEKDAVAWAVGIVHNKEIDLINILQASFLAMHKALDELQTPPQHIIVDGNKFRQYKAIPHTCVVKGDSKYISIAAASILAKTYRDDFMLQLHNEYPMYNWDSNKGYPTLIHRKAVLKHGKSPYHRKTFKVSNQLSFNF